MQVENVASYGPTIFKTKGCRLAFIISVMLFLSVIFLKISANLSLPWLRCHARGRVKAILKKEKLKHQKNSEKKHEKSYYQARLNAFDRVVTKLNAEKGFLQ